MLLLTFDLFGVSVGLTGTPFPKRFRLLSALVYLWQYPLCPSACSRWSWWPFCCLCADQHCLWLEFQEYQSRLPDCCLLCALHRPYAPVACSRLLEWLVGLLFFNIRSPVCTTNLISLLLLIVGAFFNGSRVPERFYPHLDLALNSHNLWHILTLISATSEFYVTVDQLLAPLPCQGVGA